MRVFNNELEVHRGETFTLDRIIQNKDGSPYVVSSELNNPYILISVSTTRYEQADRYLINYWLDLSNILKFKSTQVFDLKSLKVSADSTVSKYNSFNDITERTTDDEGLSYIASGYLDGKLVYMDYDDCVFSLYENGKTYYKYWDLENGWNDYIFRIIKQFPSVDTKDWVEQSYVYSITLVSGISTKEYLNELCVNNGYKPLNTIVETYEFLKSMGINFYDSFNITRPLAKIDNYKPILAPTKMSVLSVIEGGIL